MRGGVQELQGEEAEMRPMRRGYLPGRAERRVSGVPSSGAAMRGGVQELQGEEAEVRQMRRGCLLGQAERARIVRGGGYAIHQGIAWQIQRRDAREVLRAV